MGSFCSNYLCSIVQQVVEEEESIFKLLGSPELKTKLKTSCQILRRVYSNRCQRELGIGIDYNKREHRCAYLCRFMITHVCMLSSLFNNFMGQYITAIAEENHRNLRVCSIGGGPGSDFLGLLFYFLEKQTNIQLRGAVLDLYPSWKDTFMKITKKIDSFERYLKLSDINYIHFDFFNKTVSREVIEEIQEANIVTMVKFVSAVGSNEALCQERLEWIISKMKPGAILICIDNASDNSATLVCKAAVSKGMKHLMEARNKFKIKPIWPPLDVSPLQTAKVAMTIWKKADEPIAEDVENLL